MILFQCQEYMIITTMVLGFLMKKKTVFHSKHEQRSDVSDTEVPV